LRYTTPLPTAEQFAQLYAEEFYVPGTASRSTRGVFLTLFQKGCGDGAFLQSLKSRGWDVYGTETSAAGCAIARAKGISVHEGELATADFPDGVFDVITLWHVLEHLPDPVVELKRIRRMLKDDGTLVVEVPNSDSPTLRFCGGQWYALDVPRHLQHFSPSTLQRLLDSTGFRTNARHNLHLSDTTVAAYSIVDRLGFPYRPTGVRHLTDNLRVPNSAQMLLFSALTLGLVILCVPYSIMTNILCRNTEIMTIVANKSGARNSSAAAV
jgi:SAM-dependent methyltransferase